MAELNQDLKQWTDKLDQANNAGELNLVSSLIHEKTGKPLEEALETTNWIDLIVTYIGKDPGAINEILDNTGISLDSPAFKTAIISHLQLQNLDAEEMKSALEAIGLNVSDAELAAYDVDVYEQSEGLEMEDGLDESDIESPKDEAKKKAEEEENSLFKAALDAIFGDGEEKSEEDFWELMSEETFRIQLANEVEKDEILKTTIDEKGNEHQHTRQDVVNDAVDYQMLNALNNERGSSDYYYAMDLMSSTAKDLDIDGEDLAETIIKEDGSKIQVSVNDKNDEKDKSGIETYGAAYVDIARSRNETIKNSDKSAFSLAGELAKQVAKKAASREQGPSSQDIDARIEASKTQSWAQRIAAEMSEEQKDALSNNPLQSEDDVKVDAPSLLPDHNRDNDDNLGR